MQFWNNIIQTAMLGTDKKQVGIDELTEAFAEAVSAIDNNKTIDREEKFLQIASLSFNYRRSGTVPLHREHVDMPVAPAEDRAYCSTAAVQVLQDIIAENNNTLLAQWLELCAGREHIVPPVFLPVLLDKAAQQKTLKTAIEQCVGHRGAWLSQFNKDWNFTADVPDEELWHTGTLEQRKQVLRKFRLHDAAQAREMLQQIWEQENANNKAALLQVLSTNLSADDGEWLENISSEKSKKVKEEALNLLKQIPTSTLVQQYWQVVRQAVVLRKEKALLGLLSKTVVHIQLPEIIGEDIFRTGIEKVSNQKEFTDGEFIIYQLMQNVPPVLWQEHFALSPEEIISLLQKDEKRKYLRALVCAVVQFRDMAWAAAFAENKEYYPDIIPLLPVPQQDYYSNLFFDGNEEDIIRLSLQRKTEWSVELTKNIFTYTAKNFYSYNRSFYSQNIHLIPLQIIDELKQCTPADEYQRSAWNNTSEHIRKLIQLKLHTAQAFNYL